jgi:hypothetical protein
MQINVKLKSKDILLRLFKHLNIVFGWELQPKTLLILWI